MSYDWTLSDAVTLVRSIHDVATNCNLKITLGGNVLTKGTGPNLCLYVLPRIRSKTDLPTFIDWLSQRWGPPTIRHEKNEPQPPDKAGRPMPSPLRNYVVHEQGGVLVEVEDQPFNVRAGDAWRSLQINPFTTVEFKEHQSPQATHNLLHTQYTFTRKDGSTIVLITFF